MPGIGAECYVQTADIRQAVRGRETDILDNLGIPWRDGRQHIRCPYPDHPDRNPSWRWDSRRSRGMHLHYVSLGHRRGDEGEERRF
jgi:hypothetical protein